MSEQSSLDIEGQDVSGLWIPLLVVGVLTALVGFVVVWDPVTGLHAFVILVGISLILVGLGQLFAHPRTMPRWYSVVAGLVYLAAGLAVIVWPDATLQVLAIIIGISQLLTGIIRIVIGVTTDVEQRGVIIVAGVLHVLLGLVVLAWPSATLQVIAWFAGLMILVVGIFEIALAFHVRSAGISVASGRLGPPED